VRSAQVNVHKISAPYEKDRDLSIFSACSITTVNIVDTLPTQLWHTVIQSESNNYFLTAKA
jgi:hypothetical protein